MAERKIQTQKGVFTSKGAKKIQTPFQIGSILTIKIHALGSDNLGLSELVNGYTIVVPNVSLSDEVRVSIEAIFSDKPKYAIAKVLEVIKKAQPKESGVRAGEIFDVTISKEGPKGSGIVQFSNNFSIVVPKTKIGDQVKIQVTRVKEDYAFAKVLTVSSKLFSIKKKQEPQKSTFDTNLTNFSLKKGNKYHLVLPKKAKFYKDYLIVKFNDSIIFIKMALGAQLGDTVRIETMKVGPTYAVAKILKVSPLSKLDKLTQTKNSVQKMIRTGMHFGEKAIRCNANMRKYIWFKKKGFDSLATTHSNNLIGSLPSLPLFKDKEGLFKKGSLPQIQTDRAAPLTPSGLAKQPYPFEVGLLRLPKKGNQRSFGGTRGKLQKQAFPLLKKDSYYINVLKTRRCLTKALKQLAKYAAKGKTFLFVGTKKSASALIARTAMFTKTSFFVNTRWLGGMLTNWKTILKSIAQIQPILKEKQRIIQTILEKRQKIQQKFLKKVNLLRKRSQKFMAKGNQLIQKIQQNRNHFIEKSQKLLQKKNQIVQKNQFLVQKYIELKMKKKEGIQKSHQLLQQGRILSYQKQSLIEKYKNTQTKIQEFKQLFIIGQELLKIQQSAKKEGQEVLAISYGKVYQFLSEPNQNAQNDWAVPMPPADILNSMIQCMKIKSLNMETSTSNRAKTEKTVNSVVFSQFLKKFTAFLPFIQISIENLIQRAQHLQTLLKATQQNILTIKGKLEKYTIFSKKIENQLQIIQTKLLSQQKTLKTLRKKLKVLAAEQRLLKFFPSLRYLTTPKEKMAQTVQTLMKKFVDPKLTVPMEQIYDDKFQFTSKKIAAVRKQKWQRLEKYFGGIAKMAKMNKKQISNNIAVIIGQQEEMNAVRECQKLGIKMFTVVDTNCNPRLSNHIIPANDDSRNSVKFILEEILTHIRLAQKLRQKVGKRKTLRFKSSRQSQSILKK